MTEPKGHWVWLDEETCDTLADACDEVLANAQTVPSPYREINQTWCLWMAMVLTCGEPSEATLKATDALLTGLRGALTSAEFERATASHRQSLPGDWLSALPPWLAGKLGSPGPVTKTSE